MSDLDDIHDTWTSELTVDVINEFITKDMNLGGSGTECYRMNVYILPRLLC